jgi:hypothetical protein
MLRHTAAQHTGDAMDPPLREREPAEQPGEPDGHASAGARRVQTVTCGNCGWPSACIAQDGMRLLSFVCHWCGKTTVGVVDPTIRRTVIF